VATPSKKIPGDKPGIVRGQFAYIAKNKGIGRRELIFSAMLMEWQYQPKKNPGDKPGVNQGAIRLHSQKQRNRPARIDL